MMPNLPTKCQLAPF